MFNRIKAEASAPGLLHYPARPVFNLLGNRPIAKIDIFAHQIVEVAHFIIDLIVPSVAGVVIDEFKHAIFIRILYMIDPAEALIVPDEFRVFTGAGGEGVTRPGLALNNLIRDLRTIVLINALNAYRLFFIGPHFVVNHNVKQHGDIVLAQRGDCGEELVFIAIFGGD